MDTLPFETEADSVDNIDEMVTSPSGTTASSASLLSPSRPINVPGSLPKSEQENLPPPMYRSSMSPSRTLPVVKDMESDAPMMESSFNSSMTSSAGRGLFALKIVLKPVPDNSPMDSDTIMNSSSSSTVVTNPRLSTSPSHPQQQHNCLGVKTNSIGKEDKQKQLDHEISIWSSLHHPNIVEMYQVLENDDATFVLAEYCDGGTLLDYISSSPRGYLLEDDAKQIFRQLAEAVKYLHLEVGLVHRDIKLDNVLLNKDGTVKLGDMGLSDFYEVNDEGKPVVVSGSPPALSRNNSNTNNLASTRPTTTADPVYVIGSLHYCAPEELRQSDCKHPAADIWSLGCVLYATLTGALPFCDDFMARLQRKILDGCIDWNRVEGKGVSESCLELLKGMFEVKVENRWDIERIVECNWLKPNDLD